MVVAIAQHAPVIRSTGPDDVTIAIYRGDYEPDTRPAAGGLANARGLAMIAETRRIPVPAGRSIIQLEGVVDGIVPQSAGLLGASARPVEANFDFNLLTPASLLVGSLGRAVTLVRTLPTGTVTTVDGVLRAAPTGVVVETREGVEALGCSGLNEHIVFNETDSTLAADPTLSMTVESARAGPVDLELRYLAVGFDWRADYVLDLHPDRRTARLGAWLTLVNQTSTRLESAHAQTIAGDLAREDDTKPPEAVIQQHTEDCWPIGDYESPAPPFAFQQVRSFRRADLNEETVVVTGARIAAEMRELGDYKLYALSERTDLEPRQIKQVRFLERDRVKYERRYVYEQIGRDTESNRLPTVQLTLTNTRRRGLGVPLPAGNVVVKEPTLDATDTSRTTGHMKIVAAGSDNTDDVPVGNEMRLAIARALDVIVEPRLVAVKAPNPVDREIVEYEMEIGMVNRKPVRVEIVIRLVPEGNRVQILAQSKRHKTNGAYPEWHYRLRPGTRRVLRYTAREFGVH